MSKLAQKGSRGAKTVQKVPKRANEGVREGQNGGEEGKKVINGFSILLFFSAKMVSCPPFQGKGSSRELLPFWAFFGPQSPSQVALYGLPGSFRLSKALRL